MTTDHQTDPFAGQWQDVRTVLATPKPTQEATHSAPTQNQEQPPMTTQTATEQDPDQKPLTKLQKWLVGIVASGGVLIAGIGFAGSYTAVQKLALRKGFGTFAYAFPIGIDAGIGVLLALDLLLTWLRMPFPLLRQAAWGLTAATIAFNTSTAWGDNTAVGMHAAIPMLFVVVVEAARHAIGRIANITANRHIESPPIIRWILSPIPTYRIWRRMRLWQLRSYTTVVEQQRATLVYRAKLRANYGRPWRRQAAAHELLALRLAAKYGTPVADTLAEHAADNARQESANTTPALPPAGANTGNLAAANWRHDTANSDRQMAATGASATANMAADTEPSGASNDRQDTANNAAKTTAKSIATSANTRQKRVTAHANSAAKKTAKTRRSMDEWVELATPVFHAEFARLRRQPTGPEFADAIANAGHGRPGDSTAKNIRAAILDRTPLPAIN